MYRYAIQFGVQWNSLRNEMKRKKGCEEDNPFLMGFRMKRLSSFFLTLATKSYIELVAMSLVVALAAYTLLPL